MHVDVLPKKDIIMHPHGQDEQDGEFWGLWVWVSLCATV